MPQNADPELINEDIAPVPLQGRKWTVGSMASLWVGMVVCVPTYMLAASLIEKGMSWGEAVTTVMLGNVIVVAPMVLNGHPGTKYGIPFPVLARASFGILGAHVPSLLRALVACGWFGIQTWFGGSAIYQLLNVFADGALATGALPVLGINLAEALCFVAFWGIQVYFIYKGLESIRIFETLAAPFLIAMGLALLAWAYFKAGGFGPMISAPSKLHGAAFWPVFWPSLTAMVGFWATLSLNIPDFTRYAKSQRDQIVGQAIGLPTTMTLFAFIGVAVTGATEVIYGSPISDPIKLLGRMGGGMSVVIALFVLSVATLSTNLAANLVSPANALINVNPRRISFRLGGYVTAGLGLAIFPWKLLENVDNYVGTWLVGYSALLGPIGGILIVDYFLVRKTKLAVDDLYRSRGRYWYRNGFNPVAMVALVAAVLPNLPGFLAQAGFVEDPAPIFVELYQYAWFVGFFIAGAIHYAGMTLLDSASRVED